jgi:probable O-glycosylation ligase (exosortase A-associated)
MREVLLVAIVIAISMAAFVRPRVGYFGYIWFALMRPDILAWSDTGRIPYSMILAFSTLAGSWSYVIRIGEWFRNPFALGQLSLQALIAISVVLAVEVNLAVSAYPLYFRMVLMAMLSLLLIETKEQLKWYLAVIAFSIGFLGWKMGFSGMLAGGVVFAQGYGGFYSDNNTLALAVAMSMPMCWHAVDFFPARLYKVGCIIFAVSAMAAVVMTHSRGASLSMGVAMAAIALRSRHKFLVIGLMAILGLLFAFMVWDSYSARMSTLSDIEAEASAYSRVVYTLAALRMWMDYPLFGVGFGTTNYIRLAPRYGGTHHVVHNTYAQMLVDSGIFAFAVYAALLFGSIYWTGRVAKKTRETDRVMSSMSLCIRDALLVFSVGSAALSRVNFDLVYFLMAGAALVYSFHKADERAQLAPRAAKVPEPAVPMASEAGHPASPRQPMWARRRMR